MTAPPAPEPPYEEPNPLDGVNPIEQLLTFNALHPLNEDLCDESVRALRDLVTFVETRPRAFDHVRTADEQIRRVSLRQQEVSTHAIAMFAAALDSQLDIRLLSTGPPYGTLKVHFGALLPRPALVDIRDRSNQVRAQIESTDDIEVAVRVLEGHETFLAGIENRFSTTLIDGLVKLEAQTDRFHVTFPELIADMVHRRAGVLTAQAAQAAQASAAKASTASGQAATNRQIRTFTTLATEEKNAARFWTACAFALIALGIVIPLAVLPFEVDIASVSGPLVVAVKLAIALPIFGAAAYSARIAAGHREHARHMRLLAVQVDTLEAFIEPMADPARNDTRALLARRLFTTTGDLSAPPADTISIVPAELIPLLQQLVDKTAEHSRPKTQ